jgi:hypothetical protein
MEKMFGRKNSGKRFSNSLNESWDNSILFILFLEK